MCILIKGRKLNSPLFSKVERRLRNVRKRSIKASSRAFFIIIFGSLDFGAFIIYEISASGCVKVPLKDAVRFSLSLTVS